MNQTLISPLEVFTACIETMAEWHDQEVRRSAINAVKEMLMKSAEKNNEDAAIVAGRFFDAAFNDLKLKAASHCQADMGHVFTKPN